MKNKIYFLCFLLAYQFVLSQNDEIQLDEVVISDAFLLKYTNSQNATELSDSVLQKNGANLTSLLNFNSLVYFKENGAGMVSSPSFRGTSASHTAVIWNGININSSFLGQTDFNTLNPWNYDQISILPGGGSATYGSSAIGGSIHLNNELNFNKGFENQILAKYGSFNSYGILAKSKFSNDNTSIQVNLSRNASDNDYEIPDWNRKNLNGNFYQNQLDLQAAYRFNARNQLKMLGNLAQGERHFSVISANSLKTKYQDYSTRTLLEWNSKFGAFTSTLKGVYMEENYRYFPSLESQNFEFGTGQTYLARYDLGYSFKKISLNGIAELSNAEVRSSTIEYANRQIGTIGILMKHQLAKKFMYEALLRKEFTKDYKSPLAYSIGVKWKPFSFYELTARSSNNFRMPTFNDLYWPGMGNSSLKPETSFQLEIGNHFAYKTLKLGVTAFGNSISNFIQWVPSGAISVPENLGKVKIYGVEVNLDYYIKLREHQFQFHACYGYTRSENELTGNQLIYTPFHKTIASLNYSWKHFSVYYQFQLNGKVYTDSQNENELKSYSLSNLGAEIGIGKNKMYQIGAQVLNLWNENYENVLNRPMPGRNYAVYINFKF